MGFASGRRVLVTGATDGIGKAVAVRLAENGAKVIVHGRVRDKADLVVSEIIEATGNRHVAAVTADFAHLSEIGTLGGDIVSLFPDLSILINNAGIYERSRILSQDGFEMTFAVNYLAPFLLTELLLDVLRANAPSRIINVTSALHRGAKLDFDNLNGETHYEGREAYMSSKLELVLFSRELAEKVRSSGIAVNSVHPGGVKTKLHRAGFGYGGIPAEEGAQPIVMLAEAPEPATGRYYYRHRESEADPRTEDERVRQKLWAVTEELLGKGVSEAAA